MSLEAFERYAPKGELEATQAVSPCIRSFAACCSQVALTFRIRGGVVAFANCKVRATLGTLSQELVILATRRPTSGLGSFPFPTGQTEYATQLGNPARAPVELFGCLRVPPSGSFANTASKGRGSTLTPGGWSPTSYAGTPSSLTKEPTCRGLKCQGIAQPMTKP